MQKNDFERFKTIMAGMALMYDKPLSPPVLDTYWLALQSWTLAEFETVAAELIRTSEFMPRPAAFTKLRKSAGPTAGEVFAGIRKWLKYSPYGYTTAEQTPAHIASAIRAVGGADAIAMCSIDKLPFMERRFCQHYERITESRESRELLGLDGAPQLELDGE